MSTTITAPVNTLLPGATQSQLSIQGLKKTYDNGKVAVENIDLEVQPGEIVSLLGPSGCGKTTTLRSIAGLETPDSGKITIAGRVVYSHGKGQPNVVLAPEKRRISMVFQHYALWPNMSVFENVAFGMRVKNTPKAQVIKETEASLRRVQLWKERDRKIGQLSGGQQQRVALARALAGSPNLILFDEPLSNLDTQLREGMRVQLLELQQSLGFTAIFVTHDQDEALSLSSRILVMNDGAVQQLGTPREIWENPANAFVASFIGTSNHLTGTVLSVSAGDRTATVATDGGPHIVVRDREHLRVGESVDLYLRSEALKVSSVDPGLKVNVWQVPLYLNSFRGEFVMLQVGFGEHRLLCRQARSHDILADQVYLHVDPSDVLCYSKPAEPAANAALN